MNVYSILIKKRDKKQLTKEEIQFIINGLKDGSVKDYQMSALLMAIFLNGMDSSELGFLTEAMMNSGKVLDLSAIQGFKVDKHSTGGVGDKVSIPLVALTAACGCKTPMIAGRGLGHTGGTIDKLEAIPGFRCDLNDQLFIQTIQKIGVSVIGQTPDLAPADKEMYALRDVTGTVESIPLISSSIMSKKLASGTDGLVLDVKTGTGAFMKTFEQSKQLAETMISIGQKMNKKMMALITNMNQPLGYAIGNSIEIEESIDLLKGTAPEDITEITLIFAAYMIKLAGIAKTVEEGKQLALNSIKSGSALKKFAELVESQGGNPKVIDDYSVMTKASYQYDIISKSSGYIKSIDTHKIGMVGVSIGAGRQTKTSKLDLAVGFRLYPKIGDQVQAGQKIGVYYANNDQTFQNIIEQLLQCFEYTAEKVEKQPLIYEILNGNCC